MYAIVDVIHQLSQKSGEKKTTEKTRRKIEFFLFIYLWVSFKYYMTTVNEIENFIEFYSDHFASSTQCANIFTYVRIEHTLTHSHSPVERSSHNDVDIYYYKIYDSRSDLTDS